LVLCHHTFIVLPLPGPSLCLWVAHTLPLYLPPDCLTFCSSPSHCLVPCTVYLTFPHFLFWFLHTFLGSFPPSLYLPIAFLPLPCPPYLHTHTQFYLPCTIASSHIRLHSTVPWFTLVSYLPLPDILVVDLPLYCTFGSRFPLYLAYFTHTFVPTLVRAQHLQLYITSGLCHTLPVTTLLLTYHYYLVLYLYILDIAVHCNLTLTCLCTTRYGSPVYIYLYANTFWFCCTWFGWFFIYLSFACLHIYTYLTGSYPLLVPCTFPLFPVVLVRSVTFCLPYHTHLHICTTHFTLPLPRDIWLRITHIPLRGYLLHYVFVHAHTILYHCLGSWFWLYTCRIATLRILLLHFAHITILLQWITYLTAFGSHTLPHYHTFLLFFCRRLHTFGHTLLHIAAPLLHCILGSWFFFVIALLHFTHTYLVTFTHAAHGLHIHISTTTYCRMPFALPLPVLPRPCYLCLYCTFTHCQHCCPVLPLYCRTCHSRYHTHMGCVPHAALYVIERTLHNLV